MCRICHFFRLFMPHFKKVTDNLWSKKSLPIFQSPILSLFTFKKLNAKSFCHFFVITNRIISNFSDIFLGKFEKYWLFYRKCYEIFWKSTFCHFISFDNSKVTFLSLFWNKTTPHLKFSLAAPVQPIAEVRYLCPGLSSSLMWSGKWNVSVRRLLVNPYSHIRCIYINVPNKLMEPF